MYTVDNGSLIIWGVSSIDLVCGNFINFEALDKREESIGWREGGRRNDDEV
jgi:hypothetical protein